MTRALADQQAVRSTGRFVRVYAAPSLLPVKPRPLSCPFCIAPDLPARFANLPTHIRSHQIDYFNKRRVLEFRQAATLAEAARQREEAAKR